MRMKAPNFTPPPLQDFSPHTVRFSSRKLLHLSLALALCLGAMFLSCNRQQNFSYTVPVEYETLPNGLKVVYSHDNTAPTVCVAVYYNIGFRIEPRDRTGFAHLFEHMMFQGSRKLGPKEMYRLVEGSGGILNGSTRFDFTDYFEVVPSHKLETMLWAEADRMSGLAITQASLTNQQGVVKSEVLENVHNQPYGGFPWLLMPQEANANWYNAHNFYGDLKDLDAATMTDVQNFFHTFYAPNNAALVLVGDFDQAKAKEWVTKYFAGIPRVEQPPKPDLAEARQETPKVVMKDDPLATKPALAFAYHMPERSTPEYYAMGLLDQILLQGDDALLRELLVQKRGWTSTLYGGINADLGNMFDYSGPMLWMGYLFHDTTVTWKTIMGGVDSVVASVAAGPVDDALLARAKVKFRSAFYDMDAAYFGFGRANMLASFALFDNDPSRINHIEREIDKVTPAQVQSAARDFLRKTNQTVLVVVPGAGTTRKEPKP
jgi:zinc protease